MIRNYSALGGRDPWRQPQSEELVGGADRGESFPRSRFVAHAVGGEPGLSEPLRGRLGYPREPPDVRVRDEADDVGEPPIFEELEPRWAHGGKCSHDIHGERGLVRTRA